MTGAPAEPMPTGHDGPASRSGKAAAEASRTPVQPGSASAGPKPPKAAVPFSSILFSNVTDEPSAEPDEPASSST
jgi:hypothetical protein